MAKIKGQMKRNLQNEKRRFANAAFKSGLKSSVLAVETAVENSDKEAAVTALSFACKKLDKSISKGISQKNYVARQKSKLAKLVNSL
jgi:small subunit ribosomal protein S20